MDGRAGRRHFTKNLRAAIYPHPMNLAMTVSIAILSIATATMWVIALALLLRAKRKAGELLRDIEKRYSWLGQTAERQSEGFTA
jgi:hypothetical protein